MLTHLNHLNQLSLAIEALVAATLLVVSFIAVFAYYSRQKWAINSLWALFIVWPFIGAFLALLRYAPLVKPVLVAHPVLLPFFVIFIACLGHATGFRAVTQWLALFFSVACVTVGVLVCKHYGWAFPLLGVYLVFGGFYAAFCAKEHEQRPLLERVVLVGPRSKILYRLYKTHSQLALELAFKTHMIAAMNIIFCLPLMGDAALLCLLFVCYNLLMAYHMLPYIKLPHHIFSAVEIFRCAHLSASLAERYDYKMLENIGSTVLLSVTAGVFYFFLADHGVAYAMGNQLPRTGILSGLRAGVVSFLETRFSHEKVASFTKEELDGLADHMYKNRLKYFTLAGSGVGACCSKDEIKTWYTENQAEIWRILKVDKDQKE